MTDRILRALVPDASARVVAVVTTETAREAARRHGVDAEGAVALARASSATLLCATLTKGGERMTLQITGDGPLGGVTADASDDGSVRAYLRGAAAPARHGGAAAGEGRVSLAAAIGREGLVHVVRDLGLKERYSGQCPLTAGEIDEDVEHYLGTSEQIDSALGCDAVLSGPGEIVASGGVLVQAMPGAAESPIVREARRRLRAGALHAALARTLDPEALARAIVEGPLEILDVRPVRFRCRCSRRRVDNMIALLSRDDLDAMIAEGKAAEITCNFCRERYEIPLDELRAARARAPVRNTT